MAEWREESRQQTERHVIFHAMSLIEELRQEIESLEAEYRYWLVETIRMDRSIDAITEEIRQHEAELGAERVSDFRRRLDETRSHHQEIERKIQVIRLRLDILRERLAAIP